MSELFDKLILRIVLAFTMCAVLYLYRFFHLFFYPTGREQILKSFTPSKNSADTLHLFGRILGIGIIFSEIYFQLSEGFFVALLDFLLQSVLIFALYLGSIYIIESIVLGNFEYRDEILRKKNHAYSLVCFSHSVSFAYLVKQIIGVSHGSVVLVLILWLFAMVVFGIGTKSYKLVSKLPFNQLIGSSQIAIALSYTGFIWGWTLILSSSFNSDQKELKFFASQIILKILLALIIFPLFRFGLNIIFRIKDDFSAQQYFEDKSDKKHILLGHGIYEGLSLFTTCFLTTVITSQVDFGTFYPVF